LFEDIDALDEKCARIVYYLDEPRQLREDMGWIKRLTDIKGRLEPNHITSNERRKVDKKQKSQLRGKLYTYLMATLYQTKVKSRAPEFANCEPSRL